MFVDTNSPVTEHSSSSYVNDCLPLDHSNSDNFYVMPRETIIPTVDSSECLHTTTPPNSLDPAQIYVTPPAFSRNFILESNLSFDDSQDIPNISLDCIPDLDPKSQTDDSTYYSYPEQQSTSSVIKANFFLFL